MLDPGKARQFTSRELRQVAQPIVGAREFVVESLAPQFQPDARACGAALENEFRMGVGDGPRCHLGWCCGGRGETDRPALVAPRHADPHVEGGPTLRAWPPFI